MGRVVVTGIGCISAIGNNTVETLQSLQQGRSGIGPIRQLKTRHQHLPVAEIPYSTIDLIRMAALPENKIYSRASVLAVLAVSEALKQLPVNKQLRTGLVSATTVAGMDISENSYYEMLDGNLTDEMLNSLDSAFSAELVASFFGLRHYVGTISTACSSSANAIMTGARLIRNGLLDRVVVGGTDALTRFTLNGFNTLEIFSTTGCKPFDANRNGVTIGEGAGYLVLESEKVAQPETILCEVSGYANTNDAFHQTASSPDGIGAIMSMKQAIEKAGLTADQISYINAHGTGTLVNDLSESRAIATVFGDNMPPVSSTKGFTGHTLGAAGGIEAVFSVLAIQQNQLFPNIGFEQSMPEVAFTPITQCVSHVPINHVCSNSFGFGGSNTSLIFSRF